MKLLTGHTNQETAYLIEDYPYSFSLRCQKKVWVETKKGKGQRLVEQTSNPRTGNTWQNKPKASTYSSVIVLYIDEKTGYVEHNGFSEYSSLEHLEKFYDWLGLDGFRQLDDYQANELIARLSAHKADKQICEKYNVAYSSEIKENREEMKKERFEIFKNLVADMRKLRELIQV